MGMIESYDADKATSNNARIIVTDNEYDHWHDPAPNTFTQSQKAHTTILFAGLTAIQDRFIQAAFTGAGYRVKALAVADNEALRYGKEYGNRGQCNPTYFTVGNLVKYLVSLRRGGLSSEEIVENYIFITIGSCGPCRFGTYITEYRKALRDAGFDGFRVSFFEQTKGVQKVTGEKPGLVFGPSFIANMTKGILAGDILNALSYRIRPYEINAGDTDQAFAKSQRYVADALENKTSYIKALWQCRKAFAAVKVDRSQIKPKVAVIGEFWAMTTEGDGNYHLQRFLEKEGAEVEVQPVAAWIQYLLWQAKSDLKQRMALRGTDKGGESGSKFSLEGVDTRKRLWMLTIGEWVIPALFKVVGPIAGLKGYQLPNMQAVADVSHAFYNNNLKGGEGHMEVGKLILNVSKKKTDMTLSVKPFGCMPSSAVSDGVQAMITEKYPNAIFLPIETSGDGAVNVYSRIQMQLFKAKEIVQAEAEKLSQEKRQPLKAMLEKVAKHKKARHALHHSPHKTASTGINALHEFV
jgi:predicted nucleotide-binding protein (sugar kinase/HSP70/actin superfamily)